MQYKKIFFVTIIILLLFITGTAYSGYHPPKNLKVLPQDITHEKLHELMESYNKALSVKCDFCHYKPEGNTRLDFASDSNQVKETARRMIELTMHINQQFFNTDSTLHPAYLNTVTCNTCHRGDTYPEQ